MKKILTIGVIALTLIVTACNSESTIEASVPSGYTKISEDDVGIEEMIVFKHDDTGCYYTLVSGSQSVAFTQMFVEKWGVSIPYCDK